VRHSRPAKQRLWLGPDRYLSGCGRRITYANAYSYRHGHSYCDRNGDGDGHSDSYANGYGDSHSQCDTDN
jgi:hypothetical protein